MKRSSPRGPAGSSDAPRTTGVQRVVEFVIKAATENWGTKIMAFLLALIVFIVTRDEVTRSFTIPLRVVADSDRVLLTEPPPTVEVWLRGPWANVNRITADQLGPAILDLHEVRPGPMALDPASVVMPRGVVLEDLEYEPVDLRFEAVIERKFAITAEVVGQVDAQYELAATRVEPDSWSLRGPASVLDELDGLQTKVIDISDVRGDVDVRVELEPLGLAEIEFLGVASGERPTARFVAKVTPIAGELDLSVATGAVLREALPALREGVELPASERISVRGPVPVLRELEAFDAPVVPVVEIERPSGKGAPLPVTLRFEWSKDVPETTRAQLSIVPPLIRLRLSPGGLDQPAGG